MAYETAQLTGTYLKTDGTPAEGTVEIIPNSSHLVDAEGDVILAGRVKVTLDGTGSFSATLPATDDATIEPATGRQYTVVAKLRHTHLKPIEGVELAGGTTVDVADVASLPVVDPAVTLAATPAQLAALEDTLTAEIAGKQDAGDYATTTDLAAKADVTALASKADNADVTALDGRVDTVETTLPTKADASTVYTKAQTDAAYAVKSIEATATQARTMLAPLTATGTTKRMDRETGWFNLETRHFRKTRANLGKAIAGTGLAKLAFVGDSTVAGTGSGSPSTMSWPAWVRRMLASHGYPVAGDFVSLYHESGSDSRWNTAALTNMGRTTTIMYADASGEAGTFTSDNTGTIAEVYFSNMGGNFTVTVDGAVRSTGATVTGGGSYNTTTGQVTTTGNTSAMGTLRFTGLANTTHTIVLTWVSGQMQIFGAKVGADAGVSILNNGIGGQKSNEVSATSWHTVIPHAVTQWGAHCLGIMCMVNDVGNGVPVATQKTQLQTAITTAKNAGADVFLVTAVPYSTTDHTAYVQTHYELAETNDIPLLDIQTRWSSVQATNTALGIMSDTVHPNAAGYADIAAAVVPALLGH